MKRFLMAVILALTGLGVAQNGYGFYSSALLGVITGYGVSYKTGNVRFNTGLSGVYFLPFGVEAGAAYLIPIGEQTKELSPYAGVGAEASLLLLGNLDANLYTYVALGADINTGASISGPFGIEGLKPSAEVRIGYHSANGFLLGIAVTGYF